MHFEEPIKETLGSSDENHSKSYHFFTVRSPDTRPFSILFNLEGESTSTEVWILLFYGGPHNPIRPTIKDQRNLLAVGFFVYFTQ